MRVPEITDNILEKQIGSRLVWNVISPHVSRCI